jgi:hypothetical protein
VRPGATPSDAAPSGPVVRSVPANATLMGVGLGALPLNSGGPRKIGGGSLEDSDQRTIQGFPRTQRDPAEPDNPRAVQAMHVSERPTAPAPAAVEGAWNARPISASPPAAAGWHEVPGAYDSSQAGPQPQQDTPQAVLMRNDPSRAQASYSQPPRPSQRPLQYDDRYTDAPGRPRDSASVRPQRAFPWRYVAVGALTLVAYFAWLYLLDHL